MVSPMAIAEIEDLQEAGYALTLQQIIEINALGCAVEHSGPDVFAAPRVAMVGNRILHELSIQAEKWFREYAGKWWQQESLVIALAWANCYSRIPGFFKQFTLENKARMTIVAWYCSLSCTEDQFNSAFAYVNRTERFASVPEETKEEREAREEAELAEILPVDAPDQLTDLAHDCLAIGIGEVNAWTKTRRELLDILERYTRQQLAAGGKSDQLTKELKSSAENKFLKYLDKIKACQITP